MYSIVQDPQTGATKEGYIRRLSDGAHIPNDPRNMDYRAFLEWQDAGGVLQQTDPLYVPYVAPEG
jgi:hypothetical protein